MRLGPALAAALFALGLAGCAKTSDSILPVVREQLQRYPDMEAPDIYKLLYQASMGNGHLVQDTAHAHLYLLEEFDEIAGDTAEPLIERITPDGRIVRLNLRPFKARGGDPERLYAAMLRSSAHIQAAPSRLAAWEREVVAEAEFGTIPVDPGTLSAFFRDMATAGNPAVEHSESYEAAYRPSYRVLLSDEATSLR